NPGGTGRIQLFQGDGGGGNTFAGGAVIDPQTPAESTLMGNSTTLNQYDVLMLPCEGGNFLRPAIQLNNLIQFANAGGRVYSSHFAYSWMYNNPPFDKVANWAVSQPSFPDGFATVDTSFSEGQTLSAWLQIVGATTTPGQMFISTLRHDFNGVVPPTQSWLTLNDPAAGNPIMQFVFDTPVNQKTGQCGRVLYNEYHVENTGAPTGLDFPAECTAGSTMTPQEKLLEFSLFELTDDGGQATLVPTTADFGSVPIGFPSAPQTFTFTNNSTFAESISILTASGDFAIAHQNCTSVPGGGSCQITVVFTPTALGARTGTLTVGAGAQTLTAALTGTGVPDLVSSVTALDFGSVDVGASVSKTITVTSNAPSAVPFPALATTGDYSAKSSCAGNVPANSTCAITITFTPTTTGSRPGTVSANSTNAAYAGLATALTGNGIDFAIAVSPSAATTISGYGSVTTATVSPLAGFSAPVTLTCTTNAIASTCVPTLTSMTPTTPVSTTVTITTTSKFTVVGYGGSAGWLSLIAIASGWLLWTRRRSANTLLRCSLFLCFLTASSVLMTGCSGKLPAQNASFTAPGTYAYTVTATDGFLTHSATYSLTLTAH
ncbi:MAG: choice-of-anchor D domain-containing protein, partial [Acidobacteriota bacterium]|nr:choice-of-anchor D domain-containing protein [Acidobacteriota bacterium]